MSLKTPEGPGTSQIQTGVRRDRQKRDRKISQAVERHGCTQKAIADHHGLHYSSISRIPNRER
jgi:transposase